MVALRSDARDAMSGPDPIDRMNFIEKSFSCSMDVPRDADVRVTLMTIRRIPSQSVNVR
jgi:hypothetical protein